MSSTRSEILCFISFQTEQITRMSELTNMDAAPIRGEDVFTPPYENLLH